jgi:4-amino-4-deoxy-L-arabinose transferase-like glycosyltransferase
MPDAMAPETSPGSRARRRDAVVVALVALVLVLPPIGGRLIPTSHEARFALLAGDMLQRHVWFDARVREQPYRNKPPLYPWSIVAGAWWTGRVTEWSARLPGALATLAAVLGTFLLADRLFGGRAGLWAGLVLATSYGVFAHSQMILPDMPMIAFGVLAGCCFWRAVSEPGGRGAMIGFYAMLGLGVFTKGPVGLLPLAVAAVWLLMQHGVSGLRRLWSPTGTAVFVALSLVWLVPFLTMGSERFVGNVLWSDWIRYYLRSPRPRAIGGQFLDFFVGFLPWTLVTPLGVVHAVRTRSDPAMRFAALWFVVQFLLIMGSTEQRVRYLLSLYPGAALLVASWAADERGLRRRHPALAAAAVIAVAVVLAAVGLTNPTVPREIASPWAWVVPLVGLLVLVVALVYGLASARPTWLMTGVAAGMTIALASSIWVYNGWLNATQDWKGLAATVERHASGGDVGVFVSKGEYLQIDFYLGRALKALETPAEFEAYVRRPERPVVVLNQENWDRWRRQLPPGLDVLEQRTVARETMRLVRLGPRA